MTDSVSCATDSSAQDALRDLLTPGCLVLVGDGAGAPRGGLAILAAAARDVGGVRLLVGWCFGDWDLLADRSAFTSVRTVMGGYGLRRLIDSGDVEYLPSRMAATPALLAGPLRPDVAILSLRRVDAGYAHTTEVSWMAAAAECAGTVVAVDDGVAPLTSSEPPLAADRVALVLDVEATPLPEVRATDLDDESRAIGHEMVRWIPEGAAVQFGPGKVGEAALAALRSPVVVDSGVVNDAVVDLHERGLLAGPTVTAYVVGTARARDWAAARGVCRRVEFTHDATRLSARPFVALNTALEIDRFGQVNVEAIGTNAIGGVGGHGDYALAASRSVGGVSMIALPRVRGGNPTLVDTLSAPVSTAAPDVDVVVCEVGSVDLRGLGRTARATALEGLWGR